MDGPLLQLRGIGKNFGPVQALSGSTSISRPGRSLPWSATTGPESQL